MVNKNIILGINVGNHDSSACVLKNGELVAAAEEERFNRKKRTSDFPVNAINFCLTKANIKINDVGVIAVPVCPPIYLLSLLFIPVYHNKFFFEIGFLLRKIYRTITIRSLFSKYGLKTLQSTKILYYSHHLSHASSAYYSSDFNDANLIVIDGIGDFETISFYKAVGTSIKKNGSSFFPNSIGKLYGSICRYLGFYDHSKEGKVMGLSSYGEPIYFKEFEKFINISSENFPKINHKFFSFGLTPFNPSRVHNLFLKYFGPARKVDASITEYHKNIASSLQHLLEKSVLNIFQYSNKLNETFNICYSGGVALNCKANSVLASEIKHASIFIPPFSNDAGLSIGASYLAYYSGEGKIKKRIFKTPYLGIEYNNEYTIEVISKFNLEYKILDDPTKKAAELLNENQIIGWFHGRSEFGPRALGNRFSIVRSKKY